MALRLPKDLDWYVWRIVTHTKLKASLSDLDTWSLMDLQDAHDVLDALEEAELTLSRRHK